MIAGGAEAACCRIGMAGFAAARALSTNFNDNLKIVPDHGMKTETALLWEKGWGASA